MAQTMVVRSDVLHDRGHRTEHGARAVRIDTRCRLSVRIDVLDRFVQADNRPRGHHQLRFEGLVLFANIEQSHHASDLKSTTAVRGATTSLHGHLPLTARLPSCAPQSTYNSSLNCSNRRPQSVISLRLRARASILSRSLPDGGTGECPTCPDRCTECAPTSSNR